MRAISGHDVAQQSKEECSPLPPRSLRARKKEGTGLDKIMDRIG